MLSIQGTSPRGAAARNSIEAGSGEGGGNPNHGNSAAK